MKKIIFTSDFLYISQKQYMNTMASIHKVFYPIISDAVENAYFSFSVISNDGTEFSRDKFFELGGKRDLTESCNLYNIENFNDAQREYLSQFFDENTIVIGIELYKPICDLLTSFGTKVIDFAFHSYKLFDDLAFAIASNDKNVYNRLLKYQIPKEKFYYYANYWKTFMEYNNMIEDKDLENNSVLFVGQTLKDKSVLKDGVFLNVTNYTEKLKELSENYSSVYFLPHPYMNRNRQIVYNYIKNSPYIKLLKNRSTYGLLASSKISKVVGISTSVLYEAQYFNKEIEYLYEPLFNIDSSFEKHSYISIYEDCWNPKFWADILAPICDIKQNVKDINHFKGTNNKLRNIRNTYWGYAMLDPIKRLPNLQDSVKDLFFDFMAMVKR